MRRAPAVHRHLQIDDDRLLDAPLPVDEADDAVDRETAQKDPIAAAKVSHSASSAVERPLRARRDGKLRVLPGRETAQSRDRDHRSIVGAELQARIKHAAAARADRRASGALRRRMLAPTPPATTSVSSPVASSARNAFAHKRLNDGILHGVGDIGA